MSFKNYNQIKKNVVCKSPTQIQKKQNFTNLYRKIEIKKFKFYKYFKFYYFFPVCIIKNKNNAYFLYSIKHNICKTFSLENFIEVIKISKNMIREDYSKIYLNDVNLTFKQMKI